MPDEIKTPNRFLESVVKIKYFGMTVTNKMSLMRRARED
jgi:hypothetical protein